MEKEKLKIKYILITPAKNEEKYLKKTIESVISQTILPEKWIIVDDGSSDNTSNIVIEYKQLCNFIELLKIENINIKTRNFASKVFAFNYGYNYIKELQYDFIGNLDADISFNKYYYENIIKCLINDDQLGIAGGRFYDIVNEKMIKINVSCDSVRGAVQFFKKQCFLDINGYTPLMRGGIDTLAEVKARMNGWTVKSFTDLVVFHHRRTGGQDQNIFKSYINRGKQDYSLGYHPLFETIRCIIRIKERPLLLGSGCILIGYFSSMFRKEKNLVDKEIIHFLRTEQLKKLNIFTFMIKGFFHDK